MNRKTMIALVAIWSPKPLLNNVNGIQFPWERKEVERWQQASSLQ
jgi:hypothetical protein